MIKSKIKVVFDTNVWISFLIGKHLSIIQNYISDGRITIITSDQLINEIKLVTKRPKLKKYFPEKDVEELIKLLDVIALKIKIKSTFKICRDPKDDFLLGLVIDSKANFLVTGDKDLLDLTPFKTTQIITPKDFEEYLKKIL